MSVLEDQIKECKEKLQRERTITTTLRFRLALERSKLADLVRAQGALQRSQRQSAQQAVIGSLIVSGVPVVQDDNNPVGGKKPRFVRRLKSKTKKKKRKKQTQRRKSISNIID
jgi:hypothetical protein